MKIGVVILCILLAFAVLPSLAFARCWGGKCAEEPVVVGEKANVCDTFTFDATASYDPGKRKLSYLWDFGDGETSEKPIVTHTYKKSGTYRVTLTVKNDSGLDCDTAITTTTVKVNTAPQVVFTAPDEVCKGENIVFDASGTTDNTPEKLTYYWDFGDGTKGEGRIVNKSYDKGGTYKVLLAVDDNEGTSCSKGVFSKMVSVNSAPVANAGEDIALTFNASQEYRVNLDGSKSRDPDGDTLTYRWDFGDGESATGARVTHVYKKGGTYTARLTVDDGKGSRCSLDTDTVNISLKKAPLADAGPNLVCCVGVENIFDASNSYDPDGDALSYSWDFGDGDKAEGIKVKHTYTKSGTYTVTLTVKDSTGLTSVDSFVATVSSGPVPDLKVR
ncbi:MAG: PKD domain-containing protein [Candidatus Omnitrophica bacterium]|nr:PKD domain-containing protein [Candidatus Omnitrophota bacterium]